MQQTVIPPTERPETPRDARAASLLEHALDLAGRVREEPPEAVARWLNSMPPVDVRDLAILLAALVPDDRSVSELLAWWQTPISPPPEVP